MNCKTCGYPLTVNDQICKNCGTAINNVIVPNNGINTQVPPTPIQPMMQQPVVQPEVNNSVQPSAIPTMSFVQGPENIQQPVNNMQQTVPNNIIAPQPVNSSPILEQNQNVNTIKAQTVQGQMLDSSQQVLNNQPLQQEPVAQPEINTISQQQRTIEQPATVNNVSKENKTTAKPKNNNRQNILVGIAVVLLVAVVSVFGVKKLLNKEEPTPEEPQVINKTSNYTVKYNGYTFKIPTDLIYATEDDMLTISNEEETKVASIQVIEGSYNTLVTNKSLIQGNLQKEGYTATPAKEEIIGNQSFVTTEVAKGGSNVLFAYSKANSMNIFVIVLLNIDNEYDYEFLGTISAILAGAEYGEESHAISTFEKVDASIISDLIKEQE